MESIYFQYVPKYSFETVLGFFIEEKIDVMHSGAIPFIFQRSGGTKDGM